jgi:DNA uptake protein ComE-like DNA-binding protein
MPTSASERKALAVVTAIAALGIVARVVKAREARPQATAVEMLALDSQIARVRAARAGSKSGTSKARSRSRVSESRTTRQASQFTSDSARVLVDLDTAGLATIEGLPWIGPSLAARIVESRDRCGPFGSMEALTRVYGIGEGMSKRLAPYVTFSTSSRPMDAERAPACSTSTKGSAPRRRGRS